MERSSKIYLISLLIFGGGILAVLNWGNAIYVTSTVVETTAVQNDFWQVFYNTFMKQLSHPLALLLI